jgi:SpoVK/Ycf46/Vps4 family AAA+-type ATPase
MKILAQHFGAHLLILDAALMSSPALKIEEFFTAAVRLQPCILLFEDIELIFPRHLDDIKLAVVSQLAMCLEYLRKNT